MSGSIKSLSGLFATSDFMIPFVLDDLTDDDARKRSRGDSGPSIAWTIGHLMRSRIWVLNLLGIERDNPYEEAFGKGAATDGADYPPLGELREQWDAIDAELIAALSGLSEEVLDTVLEEGWHAEQTKRDQVVFFAWHEGYHMGMIGAQRKAMGYPGPAERIMAARAEAAESSEG